MGNLVRVSVVLNCTSCNDSVPSVILDGPYVISNLPTGNYTVDVIAVDFSLDVIRTVDVIVVSEDVSTDINMSPTSVPTTNVQTTSLPTTSTMPSTANLPTSTMPTTTDVSTTGNVITSYLVTNKATIESNYIISELKHTSY